jgi:hypothetical protein
MLEQERDRAFLFRDLATLRTESHLFDSVDALEWEGPSEAFAEFSLKISNGLTRVAARQRGRDYSCVTAQGFPSTLQPVEIPLPTARYLSVVEQDPSAHGVGGPDLCHRERNQQGLANELIDPPSEQRTTVAVRRRQRVGGILNYNCRPAA